MYNSKFKNNSLIHFFFYTKRACIESRDPYCALNGERCVSVSSQSPKKSNLKQDLNRGYADDLPTCVASPVGESNGKGKFCKKITIFTRGTKCVNYMLLTKSSDNTVITNQVKLFHCDFR